MKLVLDGALDDGSGKKLGDGSGPIAHGDGVVCLPMNGGVVIVVSAGEVHTWPVI